VHGSLLRDTLDSRRDVQIDVHFILLLCVDWDPLVLAKPATAFGVLLLLLVVSFAVGGIALERVVSLLVYRHIRGHLRFGLKLSLCDVHDVFEL